ncbi:hypothetical protein [Streptomyces purpureus]
MTRRLIPAAALTAALTPALIGLASPLAHATPVPTTPTTPDQAVSAPATLDTLSRFFARDGATARSAVQPRIEGRSVPVRFLSADFVAGRPGAPVAKVEFHAAKAVSADGRKASLWTVKRAGTWQVVNIATGDDETRYAAQGARALPGGIVFREPQIDAWYVHKGTKILPLDEDAVRAIGANGTTLDRYHARVAKAYGDKLPGSAYARDGKAGGYDRPAPAPAPAPASASVPVTVASAAPDSGGSAVTIASATAGAGALTALVLITTTALRRRRTRQE